MKLTCRKAEVADQERIIAIIEEGRARLHALGINQWQHGYPDHTVISADIAQGDGYVFANEEGHVVAYAAVIFGEEPTYKHIDGHWLTNAPYVVVHRMAVCNDSTRHGVATTIFIHVEQMAQSRGTKAFRVDTHRNNAYMRRLLQRCGFTLCGIVRVRDGERLAYEKVI